MATTNETARSGKTQTFNEALILMGYLRPNAQPATQDELLVALLCSIQRFQLNLNGFMFDAWDWLVALQWMQDHHLFKSNPKRPPFAAFKLWLKAHNVPQLHEQCSVRTLTYANKMIAGARYPWSNTAWTPSIVRRWGVMYRLMNLFWDKLSRHNDMLRKHSSEHA